MANLKEIKEEDFEWFPKKTKSATDSKRLKNIEDLLRLLFYSSIAGLILLLGVFMRLIF